jgi:hypothetical protein
MTACLVLGGLLAEGAARFYVYRIARQGKLFETDPRLGWRVLPGLDLVRLNADGRPWRVVTDQDGARRPWRFRPDAPVRVLVVGDSFAFGQGVDVEQRFDVRLEGHLTCASVVDLGVMGYGPDQALIAARPLLPSLRPGDWVVIVTHWTDLLDLARQRHSGRSKPWFETKDGRLVEHPPRIGWGERLRDASYLAAAALRAFEARRQEPSIELLERGRDLLEALLLAETRAVRDRGVAVLLAHHGDRVPELGVDLAPFFDRLCRSGFRCAALDDALGAPPRRSSFQADGHWNGDGHRVVAEALARSLRTAGACRTR